MLKAIKIILLTLLILIIISGVLILDISPNVNVNSPQQVNSAETVQPLIKDLQQSVSGRYQSQVVNVSDAQANSLAGFVHRAIEAANAEVIFAENRLVVAGTYKVDTIILPFYLNVEAVLLSGKGLQIDTVHIGDLPLPGKFALTIAEYLANTYTSSNVATKAIDSLTSLDINRDGVTISLAPLDSIMREFKNIQTGGDRDDARILKIRIAHYLRLLDNMNPPLNADLSNGPSLSVYLQGVMQEAMVLSENSSATLENEAAILALAIFAGNRRFTALIGDLSFALKRIPYASPKPVLKERQDLSLHFIYSAAIKLLSQKGISIAIGEFKELMDRGDGGSGYSFVDLAADLSGAHFAEVAVDPQQAQGLQTIIARAPNEDLFMVSIADLDEGLTKAEFTRKYDMVDSASYSRVVSEINTRIAALPISK